MAKNLRVKPNDLTISMIGAAISSFAIKVQVNDILKKIKEQSNFKNPEFQDLKLNIRLIKKGGNVIPQVKSPVTKDLIRKFVVNNEITIDNVNQIALIKQDDMNSNKIDVNIKTISEQCKQLGVNII